VTERLEKAGERRVVGWQAKPSQAKKKKKKKKGEDRMRQQVNKVEEMTWLLLKSVMGTKQQETKQKKQVHKSKRNVRGTGEGGRRQVRGSL
jgi:hypothetical protein